MEYLKSSQLFYRANQRNGRILKEFRQSFLAYSAAEMFKMFFLIRK